jgi:hypothetical protein
MDQLFCLICRMVQPIMTGECLKARDDESASQFYCYHRGDGEKCLSEELAK